MSTDHKYRKNYPHGFYVADRIQHDPSGREYTIQAVDELYIYPHGVDPCIRASECSMIRAATEVEAKQLILKVLRHSRGYDYFHERVLDHLYTYLTPDFWRELEEKREAMDNAEAEYHAAFRVWSRHDSQIISLLRAEIEAIEAAK